MSSTAQPTATSPAPDPFDRAFHAALAHATRGLSPASLLSALSDWAIHLAASPGKQAELASKAWRKAARLARCAWIPGLATAAPAIEPLPHDRRFAAPEWQRWPFNLIHQAFLMEQQWWHNATTGVEGVKIGRVV